MANTSEFDLAILAQGSGDTVTLRAAAGGNLPPQPIPFAFQFPALPHYREIARFVAAARAARLINAAELHDAQMVSGMVAPPHPVRRTWLLVLRLVLLMIAFAVAIGTPTPIPAPTEVPIEFVDVPDGPFLMGASDAELAVYTTDHVSFAPYSAERPQHRVTLPSYAISKTQVTNAQFRPFITGNGYSNPAYWSSAGWAWREENTVSAPAFWTDPQYNADDLPVVGVSWYEAQAYGRWLSSKMGTDIQLPTEAEWEKAARGTDGRIYPWGNTWDQDQAYQKRTTSGQMDPMPVGSYPAGASPYGVLDMAGYISEWTRSEYRPYPYDPNDGREDGIDPARKRFTLRSGGWAFPWIDFRTSNRGRTMPDDRYYSLGFRLARHPARETP